MLSFERINERVCPDSSDGPLLMALAQAGIVRAVASSKATTLVPFVKLGASLTPVIVIVKVCDALEATPPLEVPPSS